MKVIQLPALRSRPHSWIQLVIVFTPLMVLPRGDIQFFRRCKGSGTQGRILHPSTPLYEQRQKKEIVISLDAAKDIKFERRGAPWLTVEWGLFADIQSPDLEDEKSPSSEEG